MGYRQITLAAELSDMSYYVVLPCVAITFRYSSTLSIPYSLVVAAMLRKEGETISVSLLGRKYSSLEMYSQEGKM